MSLFVFVLVRPFAPLPSRRFGPQGQFDAQRRLITVPEEEGSADEGRLHKNCFFGLSACEYNSGNLGDADGEGEGDVESEALQGAAAAPHRQTRQPGHARGKQKASVNSST